MVVLTVTMYSFSNFSILLTELVDELFSLKFSFATSSEFTLKTNAGTSNCFLSLSFINEKSPAIFFIPLEFSLAIIV